MDTELTGLTGLPSLNVSTVARFLDVFSSGILITDAEGYISASNRAIERIFGYKALELTNRNFNTLLSANQRQQVLAAFKNVTQRPNSVFAGEPFEAKGKCKNGQLQAVEITFNVLREEGTQLYLIQISDISDRIKLQQQLYKKTITDPLTGMYNRRYFDDRLAQEFNRSTRYRRPFSVVIVDVDGFKQANDQHGHAFGDELLINSAKIFHQVLRHEDTAYRYGGDEFALLLPETGKAGALEVAERLRENFVTENSIAEKQIKLSLSIGIACYPEDGNTQKSLISAADSRMYHSKGNGGNMITAYDKTAYLSRETGSLLRSLSSLAHLIEKNRGLGSSNNEGAHSQNIRALAIDLGETLGLNRERIFMLEQAAMLHDIGCLYISNAVLYKNAPLDEEEWAEVKKHTVIGEEIIDVISPHHETELLQLKRIIGQHHEKIDGSGYPRGLTGDEIMIEAKILAVADAYTAMRSKRPYREALSKTAALSELTQLAGSTYDPAVVEALNKLEAED